jgi:hypothetical protein
VPTEVPAAKTTINLKPPRLRASPSKRMSVKPRKRRPILAQRFSAGYPLRNRAPSTWLIQRYCYSWNGGNSKLRIKGVWRVLLGALFGLLAGCIIVESAIPFLGYFWHVFNQDELVYRRVKVQVPLPYFATTKSRYISITRLTPKVPFYSAPSPIENSFAKLTTITISLPDQKAGFNERDLVRVEQMLINDSRSEGLSFKNKKVVNTHLSQLHCFEYGDNRMTRITCFSQDSNLTITYVGVPEYSGDLYRVAETVYMDETQATPNN